MHTFQSKFRNHDLQLSNKKVVQFKNYEFKTDNDELASLVRARLSHDIWELDAIVEQVKVEPKPEVVAEVSKKRGRPFKTQVVQGMRASQTQGEET